jgi:hypothetical protein
MTVPAGQPQSFAATVSGTANTAVTWQVNGVLGGNSLFGTIDATGTYHAPTSPTEFPVSVTAVSQADATKSGTAHVSITFDQASLVGDYVFLVTVGDTNPLQPSLPGFSFAAGTFHADGQGSITAGIEDLNTRDGGPVTNISFTGTYTLGATGRGTATITSTLGTTALKFVLTSSDQGQLIDFDGATAASGSVQRQDPTAIANVSGAYVFSLFGDNAGGPLAMIGRLISDGIGNLTGTEIVNDNGTMSTLNISGTYTIGASGRGLATVTNVLNVTQHFVFYIVNSGVVQFVNIDTAALPRIAGSAFLQTGIGSFATPTAFLVSGMGVAGGSFTAAGRFDVTGGNVSGVFDSFGSSAISGSALGTASINADGSGLVSILNPGPAFSFWMFSPTQAVMLIRGTIPANQSQVGIGLMTAAQALPLSASEFQGSYNFGAALATGQAAIGQITADGVGVFSGIEDVTDPTTFADVPVTATWTLGTNGRAAGSALTSGSFVSNSSLVLYPISATEIIFANGGAVGLAEKQCSDCH